MIGASDIQARLHTTFVGRTAYAFETIDSTNTFAKNLPSEDAHHGTLVLTDEQSRGRGRLGRVWQAEKGKNLLFSVIFRPEIESEKVRILPFASALAAADAIEKISSCTVECKWPNDLLIQKRKVAGMLLESNFQEGEPERVVLGIGVNVNQAAFTEELGGKATSLFLETGHEIDRTALLCAILESLEQRYTQLSRFSRERVLQEWKGKSTMFGKTVEIDDHGKLTIATAVDVEPDGSLLIQAHDGTRRRISAGDVSLRHTY